MNKLRSPLLAILALTLSCLAAPARAQDRPARIGGGPLLRLQLEDQAGRPLPTYFARGGTYVQGRRGARYNIRLSNDSAGWVEAVMSVDNRDVINGRPANMQRNRGYLVPPGGSVLIEGYRTTTSTVAAFRFSAPADSYAGRWGNASAAGIIRLAAYRERPAPVLVPRPDWRTRRPPILNPWGSRGGGPALDDASGRPLPRREPAAKSAPDGAGRALPFHHRDRVMRRWRPDHGHLGTAFGESRSSRIRETTFDRMNPSRPDQRLTVRYDDADGLRALGIIDRPRPRPRPLPRPAVAIESRFAEPPPSWPAWRWEHGWQVR